MTTPPRPHRPGSCLAVACTAALLIGCVRDELPHECPDIGAGELVITEIRGDQTETDTYLQWIEIFNASGRALDLRGLSLELRELDGGGQARILVRAEELPVEAGAYAVLGPCASSVVDYEFITDYFTGGGSDPIGCKDLHPGGVIEVFGCGDLVDEVVYRSLPGLGSLSFDGAKTPDADMNEEADMNNPESCWCNDIEVPPDAPPTEIGVPGTPGEANRPCI